jgi:tRNA uridine 5-carbamoylmethylation protein Kti12
MACLIVITGPSHSGKSATARALIAALGQEAVHVAIDDLVNRSGAAGLEDWEARLPTAYDEAIDRVKSLLREGQSVVFESTFTFVPLDGRPAQFHVEPLVELQQTARDADASFAVVRLAATLPEVLRRRSSTGRLSPEVVRGTWLQHRDLYTGPDAAAEITTDTLTASEVATRILGAVQASAPAPTR